MASGVVAPVGGVGVAAGRGSRAGSGRPAGGDEVLEELLAGQQLLERRLDQRGL